MNPSVLNVMLALLDKLQGIAQWEVGCDGHHATETRSPIEGTPPLMH
jgi:hypothetical protein